MQETNQAMDRVEIEYYTDPLCCWSWAFEPHWRRLLDEFNGKLAWRYRMGGLLADWNTYNDPMNSVSRPSQMGPIWMEAKYVSGVRLDDRIWLRDPPASSYPACIAVKCAELQSAPAGELYLQCLREAVMLQGRNIAKPAVLLEVAHELASRAPGVFDEGQFVHHWDQHAGLEGFRNDLQLLRYHQISRFPTLTIRHSNGRGVMIVDIGPTMCYWRHYLR